MLKLLRAGDYTLTVTGRRELSPHYLRLSFDAGGMLTEQTPHPTMWIRMWFADGDKLHQRGYTLVDPDPAAGTVDIEFALHDGVAANWARSAKPGDTVDVTVLGSNFAIARTAARRLHHRRRHCFTARDQLAAGRDRRHPLVGVSRGRPRGRQATAGGRPSCRRGVGGPQEQRRGTDTGHRLVGVRRRRTTSAGWRATTAPPARSPRCCARTTASRANPSRHRRIGWPDRSVNGILATR